MERIIDFIKSNLIWFILLLCLLIFILILEDVYENEIMICDTNFYNFFVTTIRSDGMTNIIKIITNFGSGLVLIPLCILFVFIFRDRRSIFIIMNIGIITILNQTIKFIVQRPRPIGYNIIVQGGYSFPSGYSMVSMAF